MADHHLPAASPDPETVKDRRGEAPRLAIAHGNRPTMLVKERGLPDRRRATVQLDKNGCPLRVDTKHRRDVENAVLAEVRRLRDWPPIEVRDADRGLRELAKAKAVDEERR
ncbi:MAG: hypothetical protein AB7O56_02585 [Bauldia sp.]